MCEARGYPEPTLVWSEGTGNLGIFSCEWEGSDPESSVTQSVVSIGTSATDQSVLSETTLEGGGNSFVSPLLPVSDSTAYYVAVRIRNGAGLETILTSDPLYFDTSAPPISEAFVVISPNSLTSDYNMSSFVTEPLLSTDSVFCLHDTDVVIVVFQDTSDPETEVTRYVGNILFILHQIHYVYFLTLSSYDIGLGYSPGNDDLLSYRPFDPLIFDGIGYYTLTSVSFSAAARRAVYFNVKFCNPDQLCSVISSSPVFIKSSASSQPSWIFDGEDPTLDINYQTSTTSLSGHFHVGTNCPLVEAHWAVESTDGELVQDYVAVAIPGFSGDLVDNTFALSTDQLTLHDDETYRLLVQATDHTGEVHILRSDGSAVTTRSLAPGLVQDGPILGQDLNYQESTTELYAHWSGFGDSSPEQEIVYYEIAAGSDREYASTRTDIVAFTNVGLNTSYQLTDLNLRSEDNVYYITVRAHAISGANVDSTSNGIRAGYGHTIVPGSISLPEYQLDTTTISMYWTAFESDLPIRSYEWAVGYRYLTSDELDSLCEDTDSDYSERFEIFGLKPVSLDTSATATGLTLEHNTTYYATVRAIDEAKKCIATLSSGLLIDTTVPEPQSFIAIGPEESMINILVGSEYIVYLRPEDDLRVSWEPFIDAESGVRGYEVAVFAQYACGNTTDNDPTPLRDFTDVSDDTSVTFEGLSFSSGVPYVVHVRATNIVGLTSILVSQPILLDSTELAAGTVKDGLNWESDAVFQSSLSTLGGAIAHAKLPAEYQGGGLGDSPCPQTAFYNLSQFDSDWSALQLERSSVVGVVSEALAYITSHVGMSSEPEGLSITAVTEMVTTDHVISGAYQRQQVDISKGGTVSLDILAASGRQDFQERAVTSVVFIDSGNDTTILADFDLGLADDLGYLSSTSFSAFGLQIHHGYVNGSEIIPPKVILWSKSDYSLTSPSYVTADIAMYNLSDVHTYRLVFTFVQLDVDYSRKVDLYIDDDIICSLHGLPSFSESTRIVLHVFNRLGYVPATDGFNPPTVVAVFANVTLPATVDHICNFGLPFYSRGSPVVEFRAGVGTVPGAWDVAGPDTVSLPCRPCLPGSCSEYACNSNCTAVDPYTIPFTFYNLSLVPGYYINLNQSDAGDIELETTNENLANTMLSLLSSYFQPSVYYLTVEAITASGQTATATSNGIIIDISPPELASPIEHFDASFPQMEATRFQASESTISARWRFADTESGVIEYKWVIGTYPHGQDVQDLESVGLATEATNPNLLGVLQANTTYYVTVSATNGAGLTGNATSGGVTVITEGLNLTALEVFVEVEAVEILIFPGENGTEVEVLRTEEEDRALIKWEGISDDVEEICKPWASTAHSPDSKHRFNRMAQSRLQAKLETHY